MAVIRYILLAISAFSAFMLFIYFIVSGRGIDLLLVIAFVFLLINTFYVFISRPTVSTSEVLARISTVFALISLEIRYRAQEAKTREVEADERRLADGENSTYKLQVARDMLQHLSPKILPYKKEGPSIPQVEHQSKTEMPP